MKKKEVLFNKKGQDILKKQLVAEPFERITVSFYKYFHCDQPQILRDNLYREWNKIKVFGRIYVATEGINAQLSVPENHWNDFRASLSRDENLAHVPLKKAIQDGKSFYKLTIKVRQELVSYGLP